MKSGNTRRRAAIHYGPLLNNSIWNRRRSCGATSGCFASDTGTVAFSGWDDTGYGNLVIIDHGNGYRTYYAHNEANLVSPGQVVMQGQQVAESGSTGNPTGNHLDFRILYGGSFFSPLEYLP